MLIVFDGVDCVGKSTLAKQLNVKLKIPLYSHFKFKDKNNWNTCVDTMGHTEYKLLEKIDFLKNTLIVDRLYLSNLVYNNYYKRNYNNSYLIKGIDNSIVFYITAKNEILFRRYNKRRDNFVPSKDLIALSEMYEKYYNEFNCNKYRIDTSSDSIEESTHKILTYLSEYSIKQALSQKVGNNISLELFLYNIDLEKIKKDILSYYKNIDFDVDDFLFTEKYYYDNFFLKLEENIGKEILTDKNHQNSRRFIHSSTGCLSLIHIFKEDDKFFNINIYMRSSNTYRLFPADFYSVCKKLVELLTKYFSYNNTFILKMTIFLGNSHVIP